MKRKTTLILILFLCSLSLIAQKKFQKHFGGSINGYLQINRPTSDGGNVFGGWSNTNALDFFIVKTDSLDNLLWSKCYGNATGVDMLYDVIQTTDGGYMLAGSKVVLTYHDMFFVKTDANGDTMFSRTFGGYRTEVASKIIQTSDGGYLAVGAFNDNAFPSNTSILLYKMNAAGDSMWCKILDASYENAIDVTQTSDGGYIIAGNYVFGQFDGNSFLIKINALGTVLWSKTYQVFGNDRLASVQQTTDGGFILGGATIPGGGLNDKLFLIRTNSVGDTLWTSTYGGQYLDNGGYVRQTSDGGFIQCGRTENFGAGSIGDGCLIKTNPNGIIIWSKRYGFSGSQGESFNSVRETNDKGFLAVGYKGVLNGSLWIVKTDSMGNSNCLENTTNAQAYHPLVRIRTKTFNNLTPSAWVRKPVFTIGVIDTTSTVICLTQTSINENVNNKNEFLVYPNPSGNQFTVWLSYDSLNSDILIYNSMGALVYKQLAVAQSNLINLGNISDGLYIIRVVNENKVILTQKLLKQ